ncbi:MAG: hypothetical protein AB1679_00225 [Actinomycetota bacterium]
MESVEAGAQEAGVDRAGDRGARSDGCRYRDAENLGHVSGREAPARLSHEDHAVGKRLRASDEAGQRQITRSPHNGVMLASGGLSGLRRQGARVDHQDLVVGRRLAGDPQGRCDLDFGGSRLRHDAEQCGHGSGVVAGENGTGVLGGEQGDRRCHGRRSLAAASAGDGDVANGHGSPLVVTGTQRNLNGAGGTG